MVEDRERGNKEDKGHRCVGTWKRERLALDDMGNDRPLSRIINDDRLPRIADGFEDGG